MTDDQREQAEAPIAHALEAAERRGADLFVDGEFTAHSGGTLFFKVDCDALSATSIATLAKEIARQVTFGSVTGIPRGGVRLAEALASYVTAGASPLIVDDVLTTGASFETTPHDGAQGVVIFARGDWPAWVRPLWVSGEVVKLREEAAERRGATVRLASETATESALRRATALLAVFEGSRVWVRGKDSIQDVANEITASERLAERRGFKDAIDKTSPGWQALGTALRLIRDAVEELGPVGAVPSRDAGPPDAAADAMNIIAGIQAIDLAAERRGREAMREEAAVGKEIIEIMAEYDRQEAAHEYGTPGGLEHMGDVWNLLDGWRNRLVRALPIDPPQEKTDVSVP